MKYEWKVLPRRAGVALASLLLLAGCSGGKGDDWQNDGDGAVATTNVAGKMPTLPEDDGSTVKRSNGQAAERANKLRKEFVIVRELVRQHDLQQGNDARMAAIEKALNEKFPLLPDDGATDEEKRIYREAKKLVETLKR